MVVSHWLAVGSRYMHNIMDLHTCMCINCHTTSHSIIVIVLEKRSNFAVKLIFQYEPLKLVTLVDFVHNPECLN